MSRTNNHRVSRRVRVVELPEEAHAAPRQRYTDPDVTPTGIIQGVRRRGRHSDPSLDPLQRVLFRDVATGPTEVTSTPEGL